MDRQISGIHHVTAIAGDPQRNVDFYTGVLGLRLVKRTVNFDDPGTYHLYYGDENGQPGTIMTFFPWPGARRGRPGTGQIAVTSFSVPEGTLDYWAGRLEHLSHGAVGERRRRFGQETLVLYDPDGMELELVAHQEAGDLPAWEAGPVPAGCAIRGFHGVTLVEDDSEPTTELLTETMGLRFLGKDGRRSRFVAAGQGPGTTVDLVHLPGGEAGIGGAGTVHHVAWRTPNDDEQLAWRQTLLARGLGVTGVADRQYFRSIYFREPGGVLFEIATDPPGFALDESPAELGTGLKLPPWLEVRRAHIEAILPRLALPGSDSRG